MDQNRTLARTLARELTSEELLAVAGGGLERSAAKSSTSTCCQSGEDDCGSD
jgi:hypothetical protein